MYYRYRSPVGAIKELRGHASWKQWYKDMLIELDNQRLGHLLTANLRPLRDLERRQYVADQRDAIELLTRHMSRGILQRLRDIGWQIHEATLQATLSLLEVLLAEPERYPMQSYETHRNLMDLAHASLGRGRDDDGDDDGLEQYLAEAQSSHDGLLARYGHGRASVEELLEHVFTSSVMEGLRKARTRDHLHWMYSLDQNTEFEFLVDLVRIVKAPRPALVDGAGAVGAVERELEGEDRRGFYVTRRCRYREGLYPDFYRPAYELPTRRERWMEER